MSKTGRDHGEMSLREAAQGVIAADPEAKFDTP
jgi:hypothetical protein